MEPGRRKIVLKFEEDSDENESLLTNLEEKFLIFDSTQERGDSDDDYINLQNIKVQEEICERIKSNTKLSMEELVNNIKTEVDKGLNVQLSEIKKNNEINKEREIERKRKLVSELSDYLKNTELKRVKADVEDILHTTTAKQKLMNNAYPIVYTTRLEEMNIFRKKLKGLDRLFIWEEILRESKPVYNYLQYNTNLTQPTTKNKCLKTLYNNIKIINNKETRIVLRKSLKEKEITSASTKLDLQSNKNNRKLIDNKRREVVPETKNGVSTQNLNIDNEVIDLTDAFNSKSNGKDTSLIDTRVSNQCKDLSNELARANDMISEFLETIPIYILKNMNRVESVKEVEKVTTSVGSKPSQDDAVIVQETLMKNMFFPVVYTTRLNDMLVLRNIVKFLDGKYVLNEILRESKPNIRDSRIQKTKAKSAGKINFERLKVKLQIINRKNKCKVNVSTEANHSSNLIPTEFLCQIRNKTDNARLLIDPNNKDYKFFMHNPYTKILEIVEVYRNIALIIHNKFSKQTEMLVTNDKGNITEFRNWTVNSFQNIDDFRQEIEPSKQIIKLLTCCWYHGKVNIEKIWSNSDAGIARFVQSIHKCLPGNCKCCCKPKLGSSLFKLKINSCIELENNNVNKEKINSLIGRALDYRKPEKVKSNIKKPVMGEPLLIEINKGPAAGNKGEVFEYLVIDSKRNIDWQIAFNSYCHSFYNHVNRMKKLTDMTLKELKFNIKDQDRFIGKLKQIEMPFHVIKYLKHSQPLGGKKIYKTRNQKPEPELKLIMDPLHIEHTRTCTSLKLITIKDIINSNPLVKRSTTHEKNVNRSLPNVMLINPVPSTSGLSSYRAPNITKTTHNVLDKSKRLVITCLEIPEIETVIDEVAPDTATRVIDEFKNTSFDIKRGKLVANMESIVQSTFTDEFQTLAKIVHLTQSKIRDCALYRDMKIQLNIKCVPMISERSKRSVNVAQVKLPEESVQNTAQTGETCIVSQNNTYNFFAKCNKFEKNLYKQSFESYIKKIKKEKLGDSENVVMPVISNVFSLNNTEPTSVINETTKNDFIDSHCSFASSSGINITSSSNIIINNDVNSETSELPCPIYPNYLQINPGDSQILRISSKTIVENTIEALVNKSNTLVSVGQSDVDLEKLEK